MSDFNGNTASNRLGEQTSAPLYAGECVVAGAGVAALTRFIAGDPARPLVVFLPGSAHNARIAYGGHAGYAAEDFLAHWLVEQGYNFLGISYPLAWASQQDHLAQPGFSIRSWGMQAAEIASKTIIANGLTPTIILVVWSNGGRSPQAFNEAARVHGLDVDFCVSFAATPPNAAITVLPPASVPVQLQRLRTSDGYIGMAHRFDEWFEQVSSNPCAGEGREIIPKDIYCSDYVGAMPINLLGQGFHHAVDSFIPSGWSFMEDSKAHDLAGFPLMTMVITDNIIDSRHALTDQAMWSPFLIGHLYAKYVEKRSFTAHSISADNWRAALDLLRSAPQQLSVATSGNHFFFVGAPGAREAAAHIVELAGRVHALRNGLEALLRPD